MWQEPWSRGVHVRESNYSSPRTQHNPRVHSPGLGPPAADEALPPAGAQTHLLPQLVVIALPGQLVLVLGPLGRERAA